MSVGIRVDRTILDQRMGTVAVKVRDSLADAQRIHAFLIGLSDEELTDPGGEFKYTEDEVDSFRAVFGRLDSLARVAKGEQAGNNFQFAYLLGLNELTGLQ